ncbi:MAG: hypothetical protein HY783_06045 [Chloroflexi bacterium]|nr:hypothetical protein [Chloroflexota bacterium]
MGYRLFNLLMGTALTDQAFSAELLNGQRGDLIADWPFTGKERQALLSIQAATISELAEQVLCRIDRQQAEIAEERTPLSVIGY